jgi:hypothetical protein
VDYRIVYDLATEGYHLWWLPMLGLGIPVVVVVLLLVFRRSVKPVAVRPAILVGGLAFMLLTGGDALLRSNRAYRTLLNDVRAGRAEVVEGSVTQFRPARVGKGKLPRRASSSRIRRSCIRIKTSASTRLIHTVDRSRTV